MVANQNWLTVKKNKKTTSQLWPTLFVLFAVLFTHTLSYFSIIDTVSLALQQPGWVIGVAGHTMTLVEETKLIIIGGFSTTKYFSDTVYEFDANTYVAGWQTHKWDNITGAKPTGELVNPHSLLAKFNPFTLSVLFYHNSLVSFYCYYVL